MERPRPSAMLAPVANPATTNPGQDVFDTIAPYIGQISFGALAGFVAGYALKKIGCAVAFALGVLFIAVQVLAYLGVIHVDWLRIETATKPLLNRDALAGLFNSLIHILTYNAPFAIAFIPGFLLGARAG